APEDTERHERERERSSMTMNEAERIAPATKERIASADREPLSLSGLARVHARAHGRGALNAVRPSAMAWGRCVRPPSPVLPDVGGRAHGGARWATSGGGFTGSLKMSIPVVGSIGKASNCAVAKISSRHCWLEPM